MGSAYGVYLPVKILNSLNFTIDFFTTNKNDNYDDFHNVYNKEKIIQNLYCVNVKELNPVKKLKQNTKKLLPKTFGFLSRMKSKIKMNFSPRGYYPDSYITNSVLNEFQKIINTNHYDFIYVHYINWIDLFRYCKIPSNIRLIYNMHDIDFINHYCKNEGGGKDDTGTRFIEELDMLKIFHGIICNSYDEMLLCLKLLPNKKIYYFPPVHPIRELNQTVKEIDVLYVASKNPFNIEAARWFLDEICPDLNKQISITFCGKFLYDVQPEYWDKIHNYNIETIEFIDNVEELYAKTKIIVVPILGGTGIKIKTLEALSHCIPVVSTIFGIDGFPDKLENGCLVTNNSKLFGEYINRLLTDDAFYTDVVHNQKIYYEKHFSCENNINTIKEVFLDSQ